MKDFVQCIIHGFEAVLIVVGACIMALIIGTFGGFVIHTLRVAMGV